MIEHYLEFWLALSSNKQVIDGVMGYVQEMLHNDDNQERIRHIYEHVLGEVGS